MPARKKTTSRAASAKKTSKVKKTDGHIYEDIGTRIFDSIHEVVIPRQLLVLIVGIMFITGFMLGMTHGQTNTSRQYRNYAAASVQQTLRNEAALAQALNAVEGSSMSPDLKHQLARSYQQLFGQNSQGISKRPSATGALSSY